MTRHQSLSPEVSSAEVNAPVPVMTEVVEVLPGISGMGPIFPLRALTAAEGPRTAKRGATKRLVGQLLSLSAKRRKKEGRPRGRPLSRLGSGPQASELSMPLQASTRPFTASIDFCIIACSSSFISISMTFSMPPAPITVGTPTYIPSRP